MNFIDLFEAIDTLISIRRIKETPVEDDKIERILSAATKAPSGANCQPWEFIVVRDVDVKRRITEISRRGASLYLKSRLIKLPPERQKHLEKSLQRMSSIPVMIILCLDKKKSKILSKDVEQSEANKRLEDLARYGSIFPAMQNMLLAARALGLGCWITMYHLYFEEEFRKLLHIPQHVEPVAVINTGYPRGRFKEAKRIPYTQLFHNNGW